MEAMKAIWTEEEPEYHGEFVNFDKMKQWPKPRQKPHPPIIVGGAFPYAARRAVRYGDGWIPRDDWLDIDRVVFSLPAEKDDRIMPILDQWAELKSRLG